MPLESPFHPRTSRICTSHSWKDWAGFLAVCRYGCSLDSEYFAIRESAALIDVTPLFKYDISGPQAETLLSRMTVRDVKKMKVGRVAYTCWCDDRGMVVDDGTVSRLDENTYRLTAADPTHHWLTRLAARYKVEIVDVTEKIAALAVQGPTSRNVLESCLDHDLSGLKFFQTMPAKIGQVDVWVSRTGYTGDLGYEVWVAADQAVQIWDAIFNAGRAHGIQPTGLDALDISRIEAGFILQGIDYFNCLRTQIESRKTTPFEIGLGWLVDLDRDPFIGQEALRKAADASKRQLVGIEVNWEDLEALYDSVDQPPQLPAQASRSSIPVYRERRQVGRVSSHTWSPLLKKSIGLATLEKGFCQPGQTVEVEHTVEFERRTVAAKVVKMPFFDPERKRKP